MSDREYVLDHISDAYSTWNGTVWEIRFPDERRGSYVMSFGDTEDEAWTSAADQIAHYLAD